MTSPAPAETPSLVERLIAILRKRGQDTNDVDDEHLFVAAARQLAEARARAERLEKALVDAELTLLIIGMGQLEPDDQRKANEAAAKARAALAGKQEETHES